MELPFKTDLERKVYRCIGAYQKFKGLRKLDRITLHDFCEEGNCANTPLF